MFVVTEVGWVGRGLRLLEARRFFETSVCHCQTLHCHIAKEFNFYGHRFESFHFSFNTVHGWLPESTHVCPSSSQFGTAVYFYRLSLGSLLHTNSQDIHRNKGMSVCHVYLRTELEVR
jgi:hypothetical protein